MEYSQREARYICPEQGLVINNSGKKDEFSVSIQSAPLDPEKQLATLLACATRLTKFTVKTDGQYPRRLGSTTNLRTQLINQAKNTDGIKVASDLNLELNILVKLLFKVKIADER